MKKVFITKGLPASGKTTWAKQLQEDNPGQYKRINKDDLRAMLDNSQWSKHNEKFVVETRNHLILAALLDGKHVIIDDTNFHHSHESKIRELVKGKATVVIQEFKDDVEECIKRDLKRTRSVGEKVIRQMYHQFVMGTDIDTSNTAIQDPANPHCIICDLDGTLALLNGRNPYDASLCCNDLVNEPVAELLRQNSNKTTFFFTGRNEMYRLPTEMWLKKHKLDFHAELDMRPDGDFRKDNIVKLEMFDKHIRGKYYVDLVLDDRNQVVEMWRNIGLTCFQVSDGNF